MGYRELLSHRHETLQQTLLTVLLQADVYSSTSFRSYAALL